MHLHEKIFYHHTELPFQRRWLVASVSRTTESAAAVNNNYSAVVPMVSLATCASTWPAACCEAAQQQKNQRKKLTPRYKQDWLQYARGFPQNSAKKISTKGKNKKLQAKATKNKARKGKKKKNRKYAGAPQRLKVVQEMETRAQRGAKQCLLSTPTPVGQRQESLHNATIRPACHLFRMHLPINRQAKRLSPPYPGSAVVSATPCKDCCWSRCLADAGKSSCRSLALCFQVRGVTQQPKIRTPAHAGARWPLQATKCQALFLLSKWRLYRSLC
ncbi:hypothetical protein TcCL_ESM05369 [Trypanosoma cruzi]|nr:hypothetical protein TcCL_ESM05369 [Trypanosoma cruzi]